MKLLTARRFSMAMSGAFVACLAFAAHGSTNVFDDAVFWFRGGKDCVAKNGYLQQGEFFDDLHADDASHVNHQMGVLPYNSPSQAAGFRNNAEFRLEKVVFPALGKQIQKNMPVLHLSNNSVEFNSKQYYWPQYVKSHGVFSDISSEYTVSPPSGVTPQHPPAIRLIFPTS